MVDMLMVLDAQSQLMEVSVFGKDLQALKPAEWAGKPLQDFISFDSQEKFKSIWDLVGKADAPVWRHLNFITPQGQDLPLQVSLLPQDKDNTVWMFCRDLSNVSQMQGRLVEAHQSMERDFLRLRHMEARYRLLFESVADPMMVVDVAQRRVMEANNAAQLLFKDLNRKLPGTDVAQLFDPSKREALDILLRQAQTTGRMESGGCVTSRPIAIAICMSQCSCKKVVRDTCCACKPSAFCKPAKRKPPSFIGSTMPWIKPP
jgi:PAS domain-containing protein